MLSNSTTLVARAIGLFGLGTLVYSAAYLAPSPLRAAERCPCWTAAEIVSSCKTSSLNEISEILTTARPYAPPDAFIICVDKRPRIGYWHKYIVESKNSDLSPLVPLPPGPWEFVSPLQYFPACTYSAYYENDEPRGRREDLHFRTKHRYHLKKAVAEKCYEELTNAAQKIGTAPPR